MLPYIWHVDEKNTDDLITIWNREKDAIQRTLLEHGAILFKKLNIDSAEKFQQWMDAIQVSAGNYIDGNSPRTKLTSKVYTSTEYPKEVPISLHNELSYSNSWPATLYFCCVTPALTGGSTTIADSRAILRNLPAEIVSRYEKNGVKYVRNLQGEGGGGVGKTWQQTFETSSKSVIENYCREQDIQYEWLKSGGLRLIQVRAATGIHPINGEKVWFNQADQFHPSTNPPEVYEAILEIYGDSPFDMPQYSCFGDDSPITDDILAEVRKEMAAQEVAFKWDRGDLMVVDNMLTAHGRSPFTGERKILVSMSDYI